MYPCLKGNDAFSGKGCTINQGLSSTVEGRNGNQKPIEVEVPGSNGKEDENGANRGNGIINNYVQASIPLKGFPSGKHVFRIATIEPGVVIDRVSLPSLPK